jgi:hypothetical protein
MIVIGQLAEELRPELGVSLVVGACTPEHLLLGVTNDHRGIDDRLALAEREHGYPHAGVEAPGVEELAPARHRVAEPEPEVPVVEVTPLARCQLPGLDTGVAIAVAGVALAALATRVAACAGVAALLEAAFAITGKTFFTELASPVIRART